jgi:SAM-dependent methyltransferase
LTRLQWYNPLLRKFLLSIPPGSTVLDLGCGGECLYEPVKHEKKLRVVGIDIQPKHNISPHVDDYYIVDLNDPEGVIPDFRFDAVCGNHVLEHLKNHALVSNILKTRTKSGAFAYLAAPSERSLWVPSLMFRPEQYSPLNFYDDITHVRPITRMNLFQILEDSGYHAIETKMRHDRLVWLVGFPKTISALIGGNRGRLVHTIWDIVGWEAQAFAIKG